MGTGQERRNSDSSTDSATSVATGNASLEGSNSDAAADLIQVQMQHSDVTFGEVEGYQQAALSADQQVNGSDSIFNPLMQYTSMPTRHSDYLLSYCDTEIARTERAESRFITNGNTSVAGDLRQERAQEQAGKALIQQDKERFVVLNTKVPVVMTAVDMFAENQRYVCSIVEQVRDRVGVDTLENWVRNPLPPEVLEQLDNSNAGAGALGANTTTLSSQMGVSDDSETSSITAIGNEIAGLKVQVLGEAERVQAGTLRQISAMRQQDGQLLQAEIDSLNSVKSIFSMLVSVCKMGVDIASGNFFGPFADALNAAVGAFVDHQAAIVAAQQKAGHNQSLQDEINASESEMQAARTSMRGLVQQTTGVTGRYSQAVSEMENTRDARRQALLTTGAAAGDGSADDDNGEIAARLLLVGGIIESYVHAQFLKQTIISNNVTPEELRTGWNSVIANRENNPISRLSYTYTWSEARELAGGVIGVWSWTHPSEDAAFDTILNSMEGAMNVADTIIGGIGPYAEDAKNQLVSALGQFDY